MVFANTCEILSLLSKGRYFRGVITSGTLRYYDEMPASYPDVSLLMKMCAQRKAGRSPLRFITSHSFRARLCHAKNEGGG